MKASIYKNTSQKNEKRKFSLLTKKHEPSVRLSDPKCKHRNNKCTKNFATVMETEQGFHVIHDVENFKFILVHFLVH